MAAVLSVMTDLEYAPSADVTLCDFGILGSGARNDAAYRRQRTAVRSQMPSPRHPPADALDIIQKLRAALKERKTNARELSLKSGLGSSAVSDILQGRNSNPSGKVLSKIAAGLALPVDFFLGSGSALIPIIPGPNIEVIGVAESGAIRVEGNLGTPSRKQITGSVHPGFPQARHFALEIRDRTMDKALPFPLPLGAFALCLDLASAGLQVEPGKIYAVRHSLGGGHFEMIVRRVLAVKSKIVLRAESFEKIQDIVLSKLTADIAAENHAVGLVLGTLGLYAV